MEKATKYTIALTTLYFAVSLFGVLHHELWLDEAHHWLMARDSGSIAELFDATRPDGHPILWNILLFGITRFSYDIIWMQLLHIAIATGCVFVFLSKSSFPIVFKILFIFGYFMIFEYSLISRNYILGVFFLFMACSVYSDRQQKFAQLCLWLALAANIHLMFSTIALALFLTLVLENYSEKSFFSWPHVTGYSIFALGVLTLAFQMITTDSSWFFSMLGEIPIGERISKGFIALLKGWLAIPDFRTLHFWNSNFIVNSSRPFAAMLGCVMYALPLLLFPKNRKTLFFVYVALIGMQIFFLLTQRAATRFHGMAYMIFIVALWIENGFTAEKYALRNTIDRFNLAVLRKPVIYTILGIHFVCGIWAYALDCRYAFTSAKRTVDFLKSKNLDTLPVLSLTCEGTCLSPYLEKKVWFLCDSRYQSYCNWDFLCATDIPRSEVTRMVSQFMAQCNRAVYVSYYPLLSKPQRNVWVKLDSGISVRYLEKFDEDSIVKDNYYVYEVVKN